MSKPIPFDMASISDPDLARLATFTLNTLVPQYPLFGWWLADYVATERIRRDETPDMPAAQCFQFPPEMSDDAIAEFLIATTELSAGAENIAENTGRMIDRLNIHAACTAAKRLRHYQRLSIANN